MDLISIIVPVYNVEKYLDRCMETIVSQTYKNIEIILVDDGSPDKSGEICDAWKLKDDRIKVIHKKNAGLGFARNSGLDIAEGQYVMFVDSDDYISKDACEKLYNAAVKNNSDIVYGGVYYKSETEISQSDIVEFEKVWTGNDAVKALLLEFIGTKPGKGRDTIMDVSVWKALFRKDIIDDNNIRFVSEREFASEDIIFDIDYMQRCSNVTVIPDPVYYYCVNPVSLSRSFKTGNIERLRKLYDEICRKLSEIYNESEYRQHTDRFIIARARRSARAVVHHRSIIGRKEMSKAVTDICNDSELNAALKRYPIHKLDFKQFCVAVLMRFRCCNMLEFILKF